MNYECLSCYQIFYCYPEDEGDPRCPFCGTHYVERLRTVEDELAILDGEGEWDIDGYLITDME